MKESREVLYGLKQWISFVSSNEFLRRTFVVLIMLLALGSNPLDGKGVPSTGQKVSYKGFKIYHSTPQDESELQHLKDMAKSRVEFLMEPSKIMKPCIVLLSPEQQEKYLPSARSSGMQLKELIADVERAINNEEVKIPPSPGGHTWDGWYALEHIYDFLEKLAKDYPDNARIITYGKSFEKRPLKLISISKSHAQSDKASPKKPIFFLEATMHSREWIAGAVATFLINELVKSKTECVSQYLEDWDFYIVPIANPDGYVHTHTVNRFWRKTRSPNECVDTDDDSCFGTDPNRNFDSHWGGFARNFFPDPCTQLFFGTEAFSEKETVNLARFLETPAIAERLGIYISSHSFKQLFIWPYGYTEADKIPEFDFYDEVGRDVVTAIGKRYGTVFTQGPIAATLYTANGNSIDYVYEKILRHKKERSISAGFELRDNGTYGFLLPAEQIIPTALETIDAYCAILAAVSGKAPIPSNATQGPDPEC